MQTSREETGSQPRGAKAAEEREARSWEKLGERGSEHGDGPGKAGPEKVGAAQGTRCRRQEHARAPGGPSLQNCHFTHNTHRPNRQERIALMTGGVGSGRPICLAFASVCPRAVRLGSTHQRSAVDSGRGPPGQSGVLHGAHLLHKSLPFEGPAVVLMNVLFLPVLREKGWGVHLDMYPLHCPRSHRGSPRATTATASPQAGAGPGSECVCAPMPAPSCSQGHVPRSEQDSWHLPGGCRRSARGQGADGRCRTGKWPGGGQIRADCSGGGRCPGVGQGEGMRRHRWLLASTPPSGMQAALTLSRRLLQKAMSGSVSLPENTSLWGSSVLRVSPRITYAWDI